MPAFGIRNRDRSFMRMCRQQFDVARWVCTTMHDRMYRRRHLHFLEIAIFPRVIVRPQDAWRIGIVGPASFRIRFRIFRMEVIRGTNAAWRAKRDTKILMVTRSEDRPAPVTEATDGCAILGSEPSADVDAEQPQLVEITLV